MLLTIRLCSLALRPSSPHLVRSTSIRFYSAAMSSPRVIVPAAVPVREESSIFVGGLKVVDRWYKVPLDYSRPDGETIQIFARNAIPNKKHDDGASGETLPVCLYLQGGPGFECGPPKFHPLTEYFFGKGYQMLYIDQRGTGLSTPVDADALAKGRTIEEQAQYLKMMRADNIVRDCEAIRKHLLADRVREEKKWSVHGQSFGGFCAVTYLSFYPEGLKEVFTTGGMPPLVNNPDKVYQLCYQKLLERNNDFYEKYPQDVEAVKRIINHLAQNEVTMPSGGKLTRNRFLDLGLSFGGHGGIDGVHRVIQRADNDLRIFGMLTYKTKQNVEAFQSFDGNPIYAVLHEAIYCQGEASNWSASRALPHAFRDDSVDQKVYFTGEMIYPSMFSDYTELTKFREVAELLAKDKDWPDLYDIEQLKKNEVPVFAANFIDDMYVSWELSRETVKTIKGARSFDTNSLYHNAVRNRTETVMNELWRLRSGERD
ncbi:Alpha/Beta hydrolase protein [Pyronema omphalodes]|nr:Alpha/Beta hydrolase protein [Pyronema omphalodes]